MQPPLMTVAISGYFYLLHPHIVGTVQETIKPDAILPVTLLTTEEIFNPDLDAFLNQLSIYDDVYSPAFSFALVEKPAKASTNGTKPKTTGQRPAKNTFTVQAPAAAAAAGDEPSSALANLPSGPYILHGKNLHPAYRMYQDESEAFSVALLPELFNSTDKFFDAYALNNFTSRAVAVPSKLYYPAPSAEKPLSGIRISIPENLDINGAVSTIGSRNYSTIYPGPATAHSDLVKNLVSKGAVIVGKTKVSQFASSRDFIDGSPPLNPKGDSYQKPGSTDAGAGAAMGAYHWLAYAVGQDAFHGVRDQSVISGEHSLRPTAGQVSIRGFQVPSKKYTEAGIFARNLTDFARTAGPLLNLAPAKDAKPTKFLVPKDFFPGSDAKRQELSDIFVSAVEKATGLKAEHISLADTWAKLAPAHAKGLSLNDFIGDAPFKVFCYDFYRNFESFRKEFKKKEGHDAFAEPDVQFQWSIGKNITVQEYVFSLARVELFKVWFNNKIMSTTDGHAIMLLPNGPISAQPIKAPNKLEKIQGLQPQLLSTILGTPQMTSPFAQAVFLDPFNNVEYLAVVGSLMGVKNDDLMLVQLMKKIFDQQGWRPFTTISRLTFPEGKAPRYVDDKAEDYDPNNYSIEL